MTIRQEKCLVALALAVVFPSVFLASGYLVGYDLTPSLAWPESPIDTWVPFVPAAVWPYVSWYLVPALVLTLDGPAFRRAWVAEVVAFLICLVIFIVMPSSMTRPAVAPGGALSLRMVRALYALDPPTNVFPSFHAALAWVVCGTVQPRAILGRALMGVWLLAVCAACVLTKQHYVLDVLAGSAVGAVTLWAVGCSLPVSPATRLRGVPSHSTLGRNLG
jgi:membrane-associated phospholipid phosphatase